MFARAVKKPSSEEPKARSEPVTRVAGRSAPMPDADLDGVPREPLAWPTGGPSRIVRRTTAVERPAVDPKVESRIRARSGGQPLDRALRSRMEPALRTDLSQVRVHRDSDLPEQLNARAFAFGDHVHFAPGEFNPATASGAKVIAHELAHTTQDDDGTVRRLVKFDDTLNNVVTTWREDALQKFTAGSATEPMKSAAFIKTNLTRGFLASPLPADFDLTHPFVHDTAVVVARRAYVDQMLPLRKELEEMTGPLGPRKNRISAIRSELQTLWASMVEDLCDARSAAQIELDAVARKVADEILAIEAKEKRKARKGEKDPIIKKHAVGCFTNEFYIEKAANALVAQGKQPLKKWQQNAKDALTSDELAMFNTERAMVEQRLDQWKTKMKTGQGTNADGTYGTSFGGSGSKFANNPLPTAVYEALKVWWDTVPGPTWTTPSLTTDYSLKKERIKPCDPSLSPRFNYHIVIAPT